MFWGCKHVITLSEECFCVVAYTSMAVQRTWVFAYESCKKCMQKNVIEEVEVYNQILHPIDSQEGCFLFTLFLLREQATLELFSSRKDTSASL